MRAAQCAWILVLVSLQFGCAGETVAPPLSRSELTGTTWILNAFELSLGELPAPQSQDLTLRFEQRESGSWVVRARADCNDCGGEGEIGPGRAFQVALACTEMLCPPGSEGERFAQALGNGGAYELWAGGLRIAFADALGGGVLSFRADD